ncbi:hypothetical protein FAZ15_22035 [Sphingobacterium olei]|uniref:Helix-turn-helix transcriptional regulator n=1 Tax=Sphingobacterium olei TaxID=2571155 RepID=A0A4U0N8Y0_9SPHI|nr:hypothetical protein [Sphingobacterium olei]TJZ49902.1 hypothetical protein FAZ15_22035 [Sphingobacterium olei]
MEKITKFSLYSINKIKYRRCVCGKSAYQLALDIKKSKNYISSAENPNSPNRINIADYPLIADELGCEIDDITPPDDWQVSDSHDKVDKVVVSLSDPAFVLEVLEGIKASPKAEVLEDLDKLYKHLSTKDANEKAVIKKVWEEFRKN